MGDAAFTALTTQRLVVRRFRPQDLDTFIAYRSDPQAARYQRWEAPYPPSQARQFLRELQATHPDTPGEWFQFAVALRRTDRLIGDYAAHIRADDPRQAEIGFTLAPRGIRTPNRQILRLVLIVHVASLSAVCAAQARWQIQPDRLSPVWCWLVD
jgi:Acetyltransferase (GNAT) domain